jgi:hypothetical protein
MAMKCRMTQKMTRNAISFGLGLVLAAGMAGCRIHTEKDAKGGDKNVQVDTPFGGIHVNTDQTTASDLGLPAYPGAELVKDGDEHKSADVHLGFGEWELRVKAVSYQTADSKEQVEEFYKKALGRYGDVIVCQGNTAVGTPIATSEGLTCADNENKGANIKIDRGDYNVGKGNLELKAGSKRRQHVVGFETPKDGKTCFVLVSLVLPATGDSGTKKSD